MRLRRVRKAMKSEPARIRLHESGERCIAGKRGHRPQPWRRIDGRDVPQNFTLPHSKPHTQGTREPLCGPGSSIPGMCTPKPRHSTTCSIPVEHQHWFVSAVDAIRGCRIQRSFASRRMARSGKCLNLCPAFLCNGYRLLAHLPRTLRPAGLWCVTVFDAVVLI